MSEELIDKLQDIFDEAELKIELSFIEFEKKLKEMFIEKNWKNHLSITRKEKIMGYQLY